MTIIPVPDFRLVGSEFETEEQLFGFLEELTYDTDGKTFFDKAQTAVNNWWVRAVIGINAIDVFYDNKPTGLGFRNGNQKCVEEFKKLMGIDKPEIINRARQCVKTWLSSSYSVTELVDELGSSKLYEIGKAHDSVRGAVLDNVIEGDLSATAVQKLVTGLNKSEEVLTTKLTNAKAVLAERGLEIEQFTGSRNKKSTIYSNLCSRRDLARASVAKLEKALSMVNDTDTTEADENVSEEKVSTTINPAIAKVLTEKDLTIRAKERELEQLKVELEAIQQKDEWSSEDQLTTLLRKMLPDGVKHLPLSQQVMMAGKHLEVLDQKVKDSEDVTRVTGKNLAHRVELVNLTAAQWQGLSLTYTAAKRVCTDEAMIARAEDGIRKSWCSWIEYLPLDILEELQQMLDNRTNHQNTQAVEPELQTIST